MSTWPIVEFFPLLAALLIAHSLCDYPLQGDFLSRAKNPTQPIPGVPWRMAMAAHCSIHTGAVWVITGQIWLAVGEFLHHWLVDVSKCRGNISFALDQTWHVIAKLWWTAAIVFVVKP